MGTTIAIRRTAWLVAALGVAATVLTLVLSFDLLGAPPVIDSTLDFPSRILANQEFVRSRWPIDLAGTLLFAGLFGAVLLLGALLTGRTGRVEILGMLGAGAILGIVSQLTYVGAHQAAIDIGYCDCGFKTEEVISQTWGLMLADGVADWLLQGAAVMLAIGVAYAGQIMAVREMPAAWRTLSWAIAAVLLVGVALDFVKVDGPLPTLLVGVAAGVLLPIWAAWLAMRLPERAVPDPAPLATAPAYP